MRGKVAKGEYANADQFLADFRLLVHNIIILYGSKSSCLAVTSVIDLFLEESNLANLARELLKQIRAEVTKFWRLFVFELISLFVGRFYGWTSGWRRGRALGYSWFKAIWESRKLGLWLSYL